MVPGPSRPIHAAIDVADLPSPCFVIHLGVLQSNLELLQRVQDESGAAILLALKGFACWHLFPQLRRHLAGACVSSPWEAQLAAECFGGEIHAYAPAYREEELALYRKTCSHVSFNSLGQWQRFAARLQRDGGPSCGLRLNPEHREVEVELYDPCAPRSRLGIRLGTLLENDCRALEGLHIHNLCEKNADALRRTVAAVEEPLRPVLPKLRWLNLGGGHHITRPDYDTADLIDLVQRLTRSYDLQVYLEPGEAVVLNAGVLVTTVLDIVENEVPIAILDVSASAHMPDVLEMPYRPEVVGAGPPGPGAPTVRLAGLSCLAGDVIGDYSFAAPLRIGQRLVFTDMAHYTMVKTNFFNGVQHPAIATFDPASGASQVLRRFAYDDFKRRLG